MKAKAESAEASSSLPTLPAIRGKPARPHYIAWLVLAISLTASLAGWLISLRLQAHADEQQLETEAASIRAELRERLSVYEDVLHGASGLFAASVSVERHEWRAYLKSVAIDKRLPGVDAVGFMAVVRRTDLEAFLRATQADGAPGFQIHPESGAEELYVVKFLEPEERHRGLMGFDAASDSKRREAAEACRSTGQTTITWQLPMEQGGDGRAVDGFLMFVPVYRAGVPAETDEQRWAACQGLVYARFVMRQLMAEVLGKAKLPLRVRMIDQADPERLMYDTGPQPAPGWKPRVSNAGAISAGGRTWNVRFDSTPAFEAQTSRIVSLMVACGGSVVSLLLFGIAWSLSHTRERAVTMATGMTARLRRANEQLQREIVDREAAQRSTRDSQALYHSLVQSLPLNIVRKDLTGRFTFANQRYCNELGKSLEEILGRTEAELFPEDLAARNQEEERSLTRGGTTFEGIQEVRLPGEEPRFVQVIKTPLRDGTGEVIGVQAISWDVTHKHRTEQELQHERFLLHTLMEHLPDRIYFKDQHSRFLRNSRTHLRSFGLRDSREAIGKSDFDFFDEEHAREAYEDEQRVMETGETVTKEERLSYPDGTVAWALSSKMPLRDERGRIIGTFGISRDITDRKRAEEATLRAKEAAEEASRTKSQFLANMSHELRTPLNSIIGFSNILLKNRDGVLRASELMFLGRILANGRHLLELINQILDLSKVEAQKVDLTILPVDLGRLVRETIEQQEGLVRDRPVQLRYEVPEGLAPLRTDADKLKQVLINLIGNGLKFTEQGSVTVRVVGDPQTRQPLRLEVVDTGVGIPADKIGLIFQAFQQADATTARRFGGTGLGLTISQALCHLLGCRIEVTSQVGTGSTFSILLPPSAEPVVAQDPSPDPAAGAAPIPAATASVRGRRVLVIDDETDSRLLIRHILTDFGCEVLEAASGEEGLRLARRERPDLITVDLMMPHMSGTEVVGMIKGDPELKQIHLVIVSIISGEHRGQIHGAVELLQKPVVREELLAALQRNLRPPDPHS